MLLFLVLNENHYFFVHFEVIGQYYFLRANRNKNNYSVCVKGSIFLSYFGCFRTPLMIAASDGELNLVKVLLRYGADVSHTDPHEWTAEDYAVIHGYSR